MLRWSNWQRRKKLKKDLYVRGVGRVELCLNNIIFICAEGVSEKWLLKLGLRNMSKVIR